VACLLGWWALLLPALALAETQEPAKPPEPIPTEADWLEEKRVTVEQELGELVGRLDHFFGDDRKLDVETTGSRFRFSTWGRTSRDRAFSIGAAASATLHLPHLERWLGNARLVLVGLASPDDRTLPATSHALPGGDTGSVAPAWADPSAPYTSRGRAQAELRFDLLRRRLVILDIGAGLRLVWPPIPFTRLRAHLRLGLGDGFLLRATESVFVELGGFGAGTSTDVEVGRFLTPSLRLRWEGHGVFAERTRGLEWSSLVGADWKVHPRTGLYSAAGCSGYGRPSPGIDMWRVGVGVRQDVWGGWIYTALEPELTWPRPPGLTRRQVWAVTLRLEVQMDTVSRAAEATP
jgi:hypothetical protein